MTELIPQEISDAIYEVQQSRSKFQIDRFVLGQHDTIEMGYLQTVIEIDAVEKNIRRIKLEVRKTEIEIERLLSTGDEVDAIDAEIKKISLEDAKKTLIGAERELKHLIDLWNQFPVKFTRDQIEAGQEAYWSLRLRRQTEFQALGEGKVGWAQVDAMRQAGLLDSWMQENGNQLVPTSVRSVGAA